MTPIEIELHNLTPHLFFDNITNTMQWDKAYGLFFLQCNEFDKYNINNNLHR